MAILPYLKLTRPANLVTAVSDIWAGIALSGLFGLASSPLGQTRAIVLLSGASVCLYAGGVVMNDVFDAELDSVERPERPIPSQKASKTVAAIWGSLLLAAGIILSFLQHPSCGWIACMIAGAALLYDWRGKHHPFLGPLNMGICRGFNLLLGMSIFPAALLVNGWTAVVPVIYIAAITLVSRGEVHGGSRSALRTAFVFYLIVTCSIMAVAFLRHRPLATLPFLLLFVLMVFPPLRKAFRNPSGPVIGRAVKAGVLALILLNASWVAAGMGPWWALITALLLPVSLVVARFFEVT